MHFLGSINKKRNQALSLILATEKNACFLPSFPPSLLSSFSAPGTIVYSWFLTSWFLPLWTLQSKCPGLCSFLGQFHPQGVFFPLGHRDLGTTTYSLPWGPSFCRTPSVQATQLRPHLPPTTLLQICASPQIPWVLLGTLKSCYLTPFILLHH